MQVEEQHSRLSVYSYIIVLSLEPTLCKGEITILAHHSCVQGKAYILALTFHLSNIQELWCQRRLPVRSQFIFQGLEVPPVGDDRPDPVQPQLAL